MRKGEFEDLLATLNPIISTFDVDPVPTWQYDASDRWIYQLRTTLQSIYGQIYYKN